MGGIIIFIDFKTQIIAKNYVHFPQIDSTNTFILRNMKNLCNGFVAFSTNQTAGHGTKGRVWKDFKDKNLAISILFKNIDQNFLKISTKLGAVSVIKTLQTLGIKNAKIKWFNDILINEKKIAGVLGESQIEKNKINCALGVGINILQTQKEFEENNLNFAGSIFSETQKIVEPITFLKNFVRIIDDFFLQLKFTDIFDFIHTTYIKNCCTPNRPIKILNIETQEFFCAHAIKILENGDLLVKNIDNCFIKINSSKFSIFNLKF